MGYIIIITHLLTFSDILGHPSRDAFQGDATSCRGKFQFEGEELCGDSLGLFQGGPRHYCYKWSEIPPISRLISPQLLI